MDKLELSVTVFYDGERFELKTYEGDYRNLMALIADKIDVESFGECGGMGRCATCMAQVLSCNGELPSSDRNEYATLEKYDVTAPGIRLTCQLEVNEAINNIQLKLLSI